MFKCKWIIHIAPYTFRKEIGGTTNHFQRVSDRVVSSVHTPEVFILLRNSMYTMKVFETK